VTGTIFLSLPSITNAASLQSVNFMTEGAPSGTDTNTLSKVSLEDPIFSKGLINYQPSDDFWYPPYLIGKWRLSLSYQGSSFVDESIVSTEDIKHAAEKGLIPGFKKYSIFLFPNIGKNVEATVRYVQVDSHPREDHSYNVRQLLQAFEPDIVVTSASYSYQLSPSWFYIPSNHRQISYQDRTGSGTVDLDTMKRDIRVTAGTIESTEIFKQVTQMKY